MHSRERIQKVGDSHANSPDTCGRKVNPERKSCVFKKYPDTGTCGPGLKPYLHGTN